MANWSTWSELFSSAICAVALSPTAVAGLGSLAALLFMLPSIAAAATPLSA